MLTRRRVSYDFIVQITEACKEDPVGKTQLYYTIGTTHDILEHWLNIAIRLHLVEELSTNTYRTTKKGLNFLEAWAKVQSFLKE